MALRDLFRSRLALRIYLVGLAQFAVVAAGFFATHLLGDPGGDTFVRRLDGTQGAHVTSLP